MKMRGSPFLIIGKMPHLTKLVKKHWDDPKLALREDQKPKLLKIRKETIKTVMSLAKEIRALEKEIAAAAMKGEMPENLKPKVDKLAKLKAEATMAHIRCIYNTKNVLDEAQLNYLLNLKKR